MSPPKVSVLVPAWNRERIIGESIRSALAQTIPDLEVVVADNASTDRTAEVVDAIAREDPRVRLVRNPSNLGPVPNWRVCAAAARGAFAKILWSDDLILPGFLEAALPWIEHRPEIGFVYSSVTVFREDGSREETLYALRADGPHASASFVSSAFEAGPFVVPVSPGCALSRTEDLRRALDGPVSNRIGSDFDAHGIGPDLRVFLRLCAAYPEFAHVRAPLARFRAHAGSITISGGGRVAAMYDVARAAHLAEVGPERFEARVVDRFLRRLSSRRRATERGELGLTGWRSYFPDDPSAAAALRRVSWNARAMIGLRDLIASNW